MEGRRERRKERKEKKRAWILALAINKEKNHFSTTPFPLPEFSGEQETLSYEFDENRLKKKLLNFLTLVISFCYGRGDVCRFLKFLFFRMNAFFKKGRPLKIIIMLY